MSASVTRLITGGNSTALRQPAMEPALTSVRHPGLEVTCGRLERILHGRAAQELLDNKSKITAGGIVALPMWSWLRPLVDVGRKDKAFGTGDGLLMPVRNDWDGSPVLIVSTDSVPVSYRSRGMGHQIAGQSRLVLRPGCDPVTRVEELPSLAEPVFTGNSTRSAVYAQLKRMAEDGIQARWELVHDMEPKVRQTIHKAHSYVSHEIGLSSGVVQPMLDEIGLEQVLDVMMFGEDEKPGSVFRLIELCMAPECFVKVDPLRYMGVHLRRDAETQIRRKLGDPHIGPKIREIARRYPRADIEVIVAEYRKVYPKDRLSVTRAEAALSVSPDAMARCAMLSPETMTAAATNNTEEVMAA